MFFSFNKNFLLIFNVFYKHIIHIGTLSTLDRCYNVEKCWRLKDISGLCWRGNGIRVLIGAMIERP